MASRVEYAVSMTPVVTMTSTDADDKDSIGSDIGKSLGASGSVAVGQEAHTTVGYDAGVVAYLEAVDDAVTPIGADNTAYDFLFVKHTGYAYSTPTAPSTTAVTVDLDVSVETADGTWRTLFSIPTGLAVTIPKLAAQGALLKQFAVQPASGTDHIAVEYALID